MPVIIGVDPDKASHTAAALDEQGRLLDRQRSSATPAGYQTLRGWLHDGRTGVGRWRAPTASAGR